MNKIKILFTSLLIATICLTLLLVAYTFHQVKQPLNISTTQLLTIKDGTSFSHFSKQLKNQGWLESRFWLRNYVRLKPELARIKAGTYQVEKNSSIEKLLIQVVAGKEYQFTITFIEGTTFKQWLVQLASTPNLSHQLENLSLKEINQKLVFAADFPKIFFQNNPEGLFYPETYAFTLGASDVEILQRAHDKMAKELNSLWESRAADLPYKNSYQAFCF